MSRIRIGSDLEIEKMNYEQPALFDLRAFYGFRNNVIAVLRQFGSVCPLGEVDLPADEDKATNLVHWEERAILVCESSETRFRQEVAVFGTAMTLPKLAGAANAMVTTDWRQS